MAKVSSVTEPYFSHDIGTRGDKKILKMFYSFRGQSKTMPKEELEQFVAVGAYGIFWAIVEYMHKNEMRIDDVEIIADDLRVDSKYIKQIMDDFELFHQESGYYISDRILENISQQEEKTKKAKVAAESRWLLADFCTEYEKVFGIKPVLEDKEINALKKCSKKIDSFKSKLPAILSVLSKIKFDTSIGFIPRVNWLLAGNNIYQIVNGQYGKLNVSLSEQEKKVLKQQQKEFEEKISNFDINKFDSKITAMDFIVRGNSERTLHRCHEELMKKFDISKTELAKHWEKVNHA